MLEDVYRVKVGRRVLYVIDIEDTEGIVVDIRNLKVASLTYHLNPETGEMENRWYCSIDGQEFELPENGGEMVPCIHMLALAQYFNDQAEPDVF